MKQILLFLSGIALCAATASAQDAREKQVMDKMEALNNAIFVNKDSAALSALLDDKVSYSHSDGHIETKSVMIHNAVHNLTTYRNVGMDRTSVVLYSNTAVARQQLNAVQTDAAGKESPLHLGILQVWIRENGEWKLAGRESVKVN